MRRGRPAVVEMSLSNTHMSSSREGQHNNNIGLYICMQGSGSSTVHTHQARYRTSSTSVAGCLPCASGRLHVCHQGVHWRLVNLQQPRPVDWMELLSVFGSHQCHRGVLCRMGWWLNCTTDGCCAALYVRCNNAMGALSWAVVQRSLKYA